MATGKKKHKDFKKVKTKTTPDGIPLPVMFYTNDTSHICEAKGNKEVIFSTIIYEDFVCPFCNKLIMKIV